MTGWIGDFFRFYWALFYWNGRKTWFRLRGAQRDDCPCQTYSDSGHALDSRCDAVTDWAQPARFRRVCPLLVETPQGWRCGVNAESVRPFWGRALLYGGAAALALYLASTLAVFAFLRIAHYDVSYISVVWPPRWVELRNSQEKLYATKAQAALRAGNFQEALLSLEMVTQLNPGNYPAGLALAGLNQVAGRPYVADHIYERLMRDASENRRQTAQIWFRYLLARGAYSEIKKLATAMLTEDPAERAAWLNALLFSCRQTADHEYLAAMLAQHPHLPEWCTETIGIEQMLLQGQLERALPRLTRVHRQPGSSYLPYYQVDRLLLHRAIDRAGEVLRAYSSQLALDEAAFLRARIYDEKDWAALQRSEFDALLRFEMAPRIIAQFCAWLIIHPDSRLFARFVDRFAAANLPVDANTVSLYHAVYLAAVAAHDPAQAEAVTKRITQYTASDARVLRGLGELVTAAGNDPRLSRILPLVPLPTEVVYAILSRPSAPPSAR